MIKEFNSLEEIQKYYDQETNTYIFKEDEKYIDLVVFKFDLEILSNIKCDNIHACYINCLDINCSDANFIKIECFNINACDIIGSSIYARNINAWDINVRYINACNIFADDIKANIIEAVNINYFSVCFAYKSIYCYSIKGRTENAKHIVLNGKIEFNSKNEITED